MKSKIFCRKCIEDDENNDKLPTIYVFQLYTIYYNVSRLSWQSSVVTIHWTTKIPRFFHHIFRIFKKLLQKFLCNDFSFKKIQHLTAIYKLLDIKTWSHLAKSMIIDIFSMPTCTFNSLRWFRRWWCVDVRIRVFSILHKLHLFLLMICGLRMYTCR